MSATSILTGSTMGLQVLQGVMSQRAADIEAQSIRDQMSLVRAENEADVARYAEQAQDFKAKQTLAYLKSGVMLSGSPLDILEETARVSGENISAMRAKAEAKVSEMRGRASATEARGRAAMITGIGNAAQTGLNQWGKMAGAREPRLPTSTEYKQGPVTQQSVRNLGFGTRTSKLNLGY